MPNSTVISFAWARPRNIDDPAEVLYAEPRTRIPIVSTVGGDRTLTISVNGDLVLSGFRAP